MAESGLDPVAILDAYYDRFGEAGDFDTWVLDGDCNLHLMQDALRRGSPVTTQDLQRTYRALHGEDLPDIPEDAVT